MGYVRGASALRSAQTKISYLINIFMHLLTRRENTAQYFNCYVFDKFFLWYCGPTRAMASLYMKLLEHSDEPQSVEPLWTRDQLVA